MNIKNVTFALLIFLASAYCSAENGRYFSWFQQETVGNLIVLQAFEKPTKYEVIVRGSGNLPVEKRFELEKAEFEKLFYLLESQDLSKYKFTSSKQENAADPKHYSVVFSKSNGQETALRLPLAELNTGATSFVNSVKILISK